MNDYRLKVGMYGDVCSNLPKKGPKLFTIDKGATADIPFYFSDKTYNFEDLKQLTYMFKTPKGKIYYFTLFDQEGSGIIDEGSVEAGYNFSYEPIMDVIYLELKPSITNDLPINVPLTFEVAVKLNDDDIIIERFDSIMVNDSIYSSIPQD